MNLKVLPFLFAFLFSLSFTRAQWVSTDGPYGNVFAADILEHNSTLIAATACGVFTLDSGDNLWQRRTDTRADQLLVKNDTLFILGRDLHYVDLSAPGFTLYSGQSLGLINLEQKGGMVLGATFSLGVAYTTDAGRTSNIFYTGLPLDTIMAGNPPVVMMYNHDMEVAGNYMYLATEKGIFRSDFSFTSWQDATNGLPSGAFMGINSISGVLYAWSEDSLYASSDNANSWGFVGFFPERITAVEGHASALYVSTFGKGLFRSVDQGQSWQSFNQGQKELHLNFVKKLGSEVYTGGRFNGFSVLDIAGWKPTPDEGLRCTQMNNIGKKGYAIYASDYSGVFKRSQTGQKWVNITPQDTAPGFFGNLEINDQVMYVSAGSIRNDYHKDSTYIYYSGNGGTTWGRFTKALPRSYEVGVAQLEAGHKGLYVAIGSRLYFTKDVGKSYTDVTPPTLAHYCDIKDLLMFKENLYMTACTGGRVYKNENGTWTEIFSGLLGLGQPGTLMKQDDHLFMSSTSKLYFSTDEGAMWKQTPGTGYGGIVDYAIRYDHLFIATSSKIYFSDDYGQSWVPFYQLPNKSIAGIEVLGDTLYAATEDDGVYKHALPVSFFEQKEEGFSSDLKLYPNPAKDQFTVSAGTGEPMLYRLLDSSGKLVRSGALSPGEAQSLEGVQPGIYLLMLERDSEFYFEKLIVE